MEYVELWYFCPDGCREAAATSRSTSDSDDAFGFARDDGMVAPKTIASFKASQKAVQNLSWRQFDLAKTSFLVHTEKNRAVKVVLFLVPGEGGDFSRACERHEVPEEILVTRVAPCDDMFLYSNGQSDVNEPLPRIQITDINMLEHILESHESKLLLLKFG